MYRQASSGGCIVRAFKKGLHRRIDVQRIDVLTIVHLSIDTCCCYTLLMLLLIVVVVTHC